MWLKLSQVNVDNEALAMVLRALRRSSTLVSLDLSTNDGHLRNLRIGHELVTSHLAPLIQPATSVLTFLNLEGCNLGLPGLHALVAALIPKLPLIVTNNLKVLNISSNLLEGQTAAKLVSELIKWHKGIIELDVSNNSFYTAGVSIILMALSYVPSDQLHKRKNTRMIKEERRQQRRFTLVGDKLDMCKDREKPILQKLAIRNCKATGLQGLSHEFNNFQEVQLEDRTIMLNKLPLKELDFRGNGLKESIDYLKSERLARERQAKREAELRELLERKKDLKKKQKSAEFKTETVDGTTIEKTSTFDNDSSSGDEIFGNSLDSISPGR